MPSSVTEAGRSDASLRFKNPDGDPRGPYFLTDTTIRAERLHLRYAFEGAVPPAGRSWRFSLERMTQLLTEGRLAFGRTGKPSLKRYFAEISGHEGSTSTEATHSPGEAMQLPIAFIIRRAMGELLKALAGRPALLAQVEWRDLERLLGEAFEGLGFNSRVTRPGRDGGFDIDLSCISADRSRRFLVEVKHWMGSGGRPSAKIVSAFFDVVAREVDAERGLLISTSGFASPVHERRELTFRKVALGGPDKVIAFCEKYVQVKSGLYIPDPDLLPELLFAGTF